MKITKLMQYAPKKTLAIIATIAAIIAVPAVLLAWGPSNRPTYTRANPADHVTFNSITDNTEIGDERNFVRVRDTQPANGMYTETATVTPGHEYQVYVFFHNNANANLNASGVGIAKGVYVKADVPTVVKTKSTSYVTSTIGASNATPKEVWDEATFANSTSSDIMMSYVPGSAVLSVGSGKASGSKLSDNIVTTGATIGYDALDGVIPGCNMYSGYVTFKVKANNPNFTVTKQVRLSGTTTWANSTTAKIGETVEFLVGYTNTGDVTENGVSITDKLPTGLTYVAGSSNLKNANNPNGKAVNDDIMTALGINTGNYAGGANVSVKFSSKVSIDNNSLKCGDNTLQNTATVTTDHGSKDASANVVITKVCEQPKECKPGIPEGDARCKTTPTPPELPLTGAGENIATFLGLGALVTAFGYYRASRNAAAKR